MGAVIRNSVLGIIFVCTAAAHVSAQATGGPPNEAKIPLSKIPRVHHAPKLEDFLENHPREAELTVTDFRQNTPGDGAPATESTTDRKSTRLNSSHLVISYAVFCLKKKKI